MIKICRLKVLVAIVCSLILPSSSIFGQSEKDIVSKLRVALKETAEPQKVQTLIVKGTYQMNGIELTGGFYYKNPKQFRGEMQLGDAFSLLMVANDSLQWQYNSGNKEHVIKQYGKNEFSDENDPFEFAKLELLRYKEHGHKLSLVRQFRMDSVDVYELDLKLSNRKEVEHNLKFFINKKSHLVYRIDDHRGFRIYTNYTIREGFVYPTRMVQQGNEITITGWFKELQFNRLLPDSLFEIPQEAFKYRAGITNRYNSAMQAGDSLYDIGQFKPARQAYQNAAAIDPSKYGPHNASGMTRLQLKAYYDALSDFNKAIEVDSTASQPFNNRGLAKYYIGDMEGAIADYDKALLLNSTLKAAYKNKGMALMRLSKHNEAVKDYQRAVEIDTADGDAYFKLGVALAQLGRYSEAERAYEKCIDRKVSGDELYNYRGVTLYNLKKYDSAIASFRKAFALNKHNLQALENQIRTLYHIDSYDSCEDMATQYLAVKSDNAEIHNLRGLSRYYLENFSGAIKNLTRAIELNPTSATYHTNRALAKQGIEDYDGAIADYSKSISLYPNDAAVFYKRGLVKILISKKIEGCLDFGTANEMNYEPAKEAIIKHCN